MSKFSVRQVIDYVISDGTICPECDSDQVEGGDLDSEGGAVIQRITCLDYKA